MNIDGIATRGRALAARGRALVAGARAHLSRSWLSQNPLRVKLVAVSLALVSLALIVAGAASVFALRQYLLGRVDSQLRSTVITETSDTRGPAPTRFAIPSDFMVAVRYFSPADQKYVIPVQASMWEVLPDLNDFDAWADETGPFTVVNSEGTPWRLLLTPVHVSITVDGQPQMVDGTLIVGEKIAQVSSSVNQLLVTDTLVGLAVLMLLALVGVWLVRRSLRPLGEIERTAVAIAGGDLTRRVPELDPRTELGQLSLALNTMLNQIEAAFEARAASEARAIGSEERMRQFVADASHELRTPLTTIRGFAELYRQGAAPDPGEVLRRIEGEAARMGLLVEDLLLLARLDQARPLVFEPVDLGPVVADAASAAHAVDPNRPITLDAPATPVIVEADEARLRQVIGNLVTNALTHTPPGTPVDISLSAVDGTALVEVADQGPGLDPEQAPHVFERFFRIDKARTRSQASPGHSGAGLGLAIVAALVAAHHGTVTVQTAPGYGATFRVRLPLLPTDPDAELDGPEPIAAPAPTPAPAPAA